MCDSFPAISAEQLTKAVNLAAAGTLSALDEQGSARDKKNEFGHDPSHKGPAVSKCIIQVVPGSVKTPNICREDVTPSTSFYGRARKISTKTKSEKCPTTSSGKRYSSRKNYKLSPPLIPNGIRNIGAQMLLNSQVVKISHAASNNISPSIQTSKVASTTHTIRPITLIHSPQQLSQNLPKTSSESNSLLSSILQSPPREMSAQPSDLFLQRLNTDDKKMEVVTSSPSQIERLALMSAPTKDKPKSPQFIPITKPDSVFRVPFPVNYTQPASTTSFQIVRLAPTSLNSNNFSFLNVGNSSPVSPVISSNQVCSQMVLHREKPTTFSPPSPIENKISLPTSVPVTTTGPSHMVTSCVVSPKCLTVFHTSTTTTRQNVTASEKTGNVGVKATSIVSLPSPINFSPLTHQLVSPVEKTNLSSTHSAKSTSESIQTASRFVTIRPNLILPKDCKLSTIMSSSSQVRPLLIVSSSSNVNASGSPAKTSSNQSATGVTNNNPGIIFMPSVINSVPLIQSTTQSLVTAPKSQAQLDIKSPVSKAEINMCNLASLTHGVAGHGVQKTYQISPNSPTVQSSPSAISSRCQTSSVIQSSCHDTSMSTSASSNNQITSTKLPAVNLFHSVQSIACCVATTLSSSSPVLSTPNTGYTYCVSSLHPVTSSGLTSSKDKPSQLSISPMSPAPGPVIPRMPLTVVKDPFSSKPPQSKVRLAVYPLPPGFQLAPTTSVTSVPVLHSPTASVPSPTVLTSKPDKERETLSQSSSQPQQISSCISNTVTTSMFSTASNLPLSSIVPSTGTMSANTSGKQHLGESLQSSSTKGRKLVISPAGINQLQSLLRKMGTKEGYFIISTPRPVPEAPQQKPLTLNLQGLTNSPPVTIKTSPQSQCDLTPTVSMSNMKYTSMTVTSTCTSPVTCETTDMHSLGANSSLAHSLKHDNLTGAEDTVVSGEGNTASKLELPSNQTEAMSDVESEVLEDEDSDDGDSSSSEDSSCSSNALVIETNEHMIDSLSSSTPIKDLEDVNKSISSPKDASMSPSKDPTEPGTTQDMNVTLDSNITSPLSLNEIVRHHQSRYGLEYQPLYSPPFSSCKEVIMSASGITQEGKTDKEDQVVSSHAESSEIRFPVPESPLGISSLLRHHHQQQQNNHHPLHLHQSQADNQHIYEQSLNTPHALYTHHDQINDIHMHNSSDIEAAMNLQRLSECPGPPPPASSSAVQNAVNASSNSSNVTSPKSPLSINSSQPVESHTPLHPPMTPNTMLINLLNRVPTPLLTNHQDLLSVPSSQENEIHFQGSNQPLDTSSSSSTNKDVHPGKSTASSLQQTMGNSSKDPSCHGLYNPPSHSVLADNAGSFGHHTQTQNALDLIASNYLPTNRKEISNGLSDQIPTFSNSAASTQNFTLFSTTWPQGNNSTMTFSTPEYNVGQFNVNVNTPPTDVEHSLQKADHSSHCKTCCLPITITVNLDSNNPSVSTSNATTTESHQNISESHHELEQAFNDQHNQLPQQQCVLFDNFATGVNPVQEKCRDAEIIRHLIMNTGTKNTASFLTEAQSMSSFETINQPLQNCHFEQRAQNSFISSGEAPNDLHCSVSESDSQFAPPGYHQRMSMPENLSQENCHENFNNLNSSGSLIYDNDSSYENVQMEVGERIENCSFDINSSASEATFRTSANSVFDTSQSHVFINAQNSTNSSFIMPSSLSDIHTSFDAETIRTKEQMPLHPSQIQQDGKHPQSSEFGSSIEQNELFFHQSSASESHSNDLHLYDINALHDSSHDMGYSLSDMENHENQLQNHRECLQPTHCSDIQPGLISNQCDIQGSNKQLQDHPFDFSIQQNHQFPREPVNQTGSIQQNHQFSREPVNQTGPIQQNHQFPREPVDQTGSIQQNHQFSREPVDQTGSIQQNHQFSREPVDQTGSIQQNHQFSREPVDQTGSIQQNHQFSREPVNQAGSIQQNHQFPREPVNQTGSDGSVVTFSDNQSNLSGYMNEAFPSHFYTNSAGSNIPMFSQQCPVGSEAPLLDSNNLALNCSQLPSYKNSASDIQMEFHYQPQDESTAVGEKQLVLPSASFSPPSVADPAATPDPGAMEIYNGSFQNLSAYDTYLRGGQSESRAQLGEPSPESGKFCVECNIMYKNQCKFHPCDCNDISDAPILSHARLTLPPCLKVAPSEVAGHTNKTGVFAREAIAVRTKFGPLVGSPVSCDQLGSTRSFSLWQTFIGSNVKVIDTSDENSSNWLMFVKPACVSSEQNLVVFQHSNRVYFVTRTEVKEGQELRYWFSKDYARMLGISSKPKNAQHQLCPHCPVCKQVFADRKQVRSHIRIQHPKPQVNKCSHCSKRFSQVSHLNAHVLAVHLNVKKFVCHHCNKRFGDSSNLRKHIKSHSDERNFKCQICSKAFRQKAHLQVHMNSHMPVKHEQCRFCGNRFTRAFERKQHELQHTKQNRIECQHCGKVFHKQKIFKEHMKIHTNERNFPCNHCGKAFRNKFALTRHGPACKQRKRGLSLVPANPATNDILSRHLGTSSSSHSSPMGGSSTTDFAKSTTEEDLSMASSSVSSSGLSNDV